MIASGPFRRACASSRRCGGGTSSGVEPAFFPGLLSEQVLSASAVPLSLSADVPTAFGKPRRRRKAADGFVPRRPAPRRRPAAVRALGAAKNPAGLREDIGMEIWRKTGRGRSRCSGRPVSARRERNYRNCKGGEFRLKFGKRSESASGKTPGGTTCKPEFPPCVGFTRGVFLLSGALTA